MKVLNGSDIDNLILNSLKKNENIDLFVGKGKNKRLVIKKGLKLEHIPTGLIFRVLKVGMVGGKPGILCDGPDGEELIKSSDFKNYKVKQ